MLVYIAYKYTHIKDKDALKEQLKVISELIRATGNKTFLLLRDVKKWGHEHTPMFQTVPHIFINILKSDVVFAFISSEVPSSGLGFELLCATLLGKRKLIAVKNGIDVKYKNNKNTSVFTFKSIDDLEKQIKEQLSK